MFLNKKPNNPNPIFRPECINARGVCCMRLLGALCVMACVFRASAQTCAVGQVLVNSVCTYNDPALKYRFKFEEINPELNSGSASIHQARTPGIITLSSDAKEGTRSLISDVNWMQLSTPSTMVDLEIFSMSFWLRGASYNSQTKQIWTWMASNFFSFGFSPVNEKLYYNDGTNVIYAVSFTNNQWTHIVVIHNYATIQIYVNGIMSYQIVRSYYKTGFAGNCIFDLMSGGEFNIKVDDFRIYNRVITAQEAMWLYKPCTVDAPFYFDTYTCPIVCTAGAYAVPGATSCTNCTAGKYSTVTGATSASVCMNCLAGAYSGVSGASACTNCSAGAYSGVTGASSSSACVKCPAGAFSGAAGATSVNTCVLCPAGTYSSTVGASSSAACTNCIAGTYSGVSGASSSAACTPCPAGAYSSVAGATNASTCVQCPAGAYSSTAGASACVLCPTSSFSTPGSTSITNCACNAGFYGANGGTCTACTATFTSLPGSLTAAGCGCAENTYNYIMPVGGIQRACGINSNEECPTSQSKTYQTGNEASKSVDLDTSNTYSWATWVAYPPSGSQSTWWRVDLGTPRFISKFNIYFQGANHYVMQIGNIDSFDANPTCAMGNVNSGAYTIYCQTACASIITAEGFITSSTSLINSCREETTGNYNQVPMTGRYVFIRSGNADAPGMYRWWDLKMSNVDITILVPVCATCPAQSITPFNTSSKSISSCNCRPGYTGPDGGTCSACVAGKFKSSTGSASCTDCPSGTYSSTVGANTSVVCQACFANMNSPVSSTSSSWCSCTLGYYAVNSSACALCPPGKYAVPGTTTSDQCCWPGQGLLNAVCSYNDPDLRIWLKFNSPLVNYGTWSMSLPTTQSFTYQSATCSPTTSYAQQCIRGNSCIQFPSKESCCSNLPYYYYACHSTPSYTITSSNAMTTYQSSDITVSFWFKFNNIIDLSRESYYYMLQYIPYFYINSNAGKWVYSSFGSLNQNVELPMTSSMSSRFMSGSGNTYIGKWQHICLTFEKLTRKTTLYIDGIFDTSNIVSGGNTYTAYNQIMINYGSQVPVTYDDLRLYTRLLNAAELQWLYSPCDAGLAYDEDTYSCGCPPGYIPTGANCTACLPGKYRMTAATACTDCAVNTYSSVSGASSISTCSSCVLYSSSPMASTSINACSCNPGATGNGTWCTLCVAGKYKNASGSALCDECPANMYSTSIGANTASVCLSCPGNSSSPSSSSTSSVCRCLIGFTGPDGGVCNSCVAGKYKNTSGSATCTNCAGGSFSASVGASTCSSCAESFSSTAGSSVCQCAAGYGVMSDGTCALCEAGKFKGAIANANCTSCAAGTYMAGVGATVCLTCAAYADADVPRVECRCNAGATGNGSVCVRCVAGKYKGVSGNSSCIDCGVNMYSTTVGATGTGACVSCPVNAVSGAGSAVIGSCVCNVGATGPNGGTCTLCAVGKYKSVNGTAACTDCLAGSYSGRIGANNSETCVSCPDNSSSVVSSSALTGCTCNAGATGPNGGPCALCVPGKYKTVIGTAVCTNCSANTFSSVTGATSISACSTCPANSQSVGASAVCVCNRGFTGPDGGPCLACVPGTFKTQIGAADCTFCPNNTFSGVIGSTNASVCQACQTNAISAAGSVDQEYCYCKPGYAHLEGRHACRECTPGTYNSHLGKRACSNCTIGMYSVNYTAISPETCKFCPEGQWSPEGSANCNLCPVHSHTLNISGSITDCVCDPGYIGPGGSTCIACAAGLYKDFTGPEGCTVCPALTSSFPGTERATDCWCVSGYIKVAGVCVQMIPRPIEISGTLEDLPVNPSASQIQNASEYLRRSIAKQLNVAIELVQVDPVANSSNVQVLLFARSETEVSLLQSKVAVATSALTQSSLPFLLLPTGNASVGEPRIVLITVDIYYEARRRSRESEVMFTVTTELTEYFDVPVYDISYTFDASGTVEVPRVVISIRTSTQEEYVRVLNSAQELLAQGNVTLPELRMDLIAVGDSGPSGLNFTHALIRPDGSPMSGAEVQASLQAIIQQLSWFYNVPEYDVSVVITANASACVDLNGTSTCFEEVYTVQVFVEANVMVSTENLQERYLLMSETVETPQPLVMELPFELENIYYFTDTGVNDFYVEMELVDSDGLFLDETQVAEADEALTWHVAEFFGVDASKVHFEIIAPRFPMLNNASNVRVWFECAQEDLPEMLDRASQLTATATILVQPFRITGLSNAVQKTVHGQMVDGVFVECRPNFIIDALVCKCKPGYRLSGTSCIPCEAGTYSIALDTLQCTACDVATFSLGGATACTSCHANSNASIGSSSQNACQCNPGFFFLTLVENGLLDYNTVANQYCLPCVNGSYKNQSGNFNCSTCLTQYYSSDALSCNTCNYGYAPYAPNGTNNSVCVSCPPGSFKPTPSSGPCLPCAADTFSNVTTASSCNSCPIGYRSLSGTVNSTDCCGLNSRPQNITCTTGAVNVIASYSSTACARFIALTPKPSFASISTRNNAAVGTMPTFIAAGGPNGKGHFSFDRTKSQYLDAGSRTFNIASNGGLTIVLVMRFTGSISAWERVLELGIQGQFGTNSMLVARQSSSTSLLVDIFNGVGNNRVLSVATAALIVQNSWLTVVVQYSASNRGYSISVNGAVTNTGTIATAITDRTLTHNWIARSNNGEAHLNADIAGVFVVDEYLGTTATTAISDTMIQGVDLTSAPCEGTAQSCSFGIRCSCNTGYTGPDTGASKGQCSICPAGTYKNSSGTANCTACPLNSNSSAGSGNITDCICDAWCSGPRGGPCVPNNSTFNASSRVFQCSPGFTGPDRTGPCVTCSAGSYKNVSGPDACSFCAPGQYQDALATRSCLSCAPDTFENASGSVACQKCPVGFKSLPATTSVQDCCGLNSAPEIPVCMNANLARSCGASGFDACTASGSSFYPYHPQGAVVFGPPMAINGILEENGYISGQGGSPWWQVDFSRQVTIKYVRIYGNGWQPQWLNNFNLQLSNDGSTFINCATGQYPSLDYAKGLVSDHICDGTARYLRLSLNLVGGAFLQLPEVQVYGNPPVCGVACLCNAGYTGPDTGASKGQCTICPSGTYKNSSGSANCTSCPVNSNSSVGSMLVTSCSCNPGYTGPDGGPCPTCDAGKFKNASGSQACDVCAVNTYSASGALFCTACPAGFTSPNGSTVFSDCCDPNTTYAKNVYDALSSTTKTALDPNIYRSAFVARVSSAPELKHYKSQPNPPSYFSSGGYRGQAFLRFSKTSSTSGHNILSYPGSSFNGGAIGNTVVIVIRFMENIKGVFYGMQSGTEGNFFELYLSDTLQFCVRSQFYNWMSCCTCTDTAVPINVWLQVSYTDNPSASPRQTLKVAYMPTTGTTIVLSKTNGDAGTWGMNDGIKTVIGYSAGCLGMLREFPMPSTLNAACDRPNFDLAGFYLIQTAASDADIAVLLEAIAIGTQILYDKISTCQCNAGFGGTGRSNCASCAPGTYKSEVQSVSCSLCAANTYSTAVQAINVSTCLACPSNSESVPGRFECECTFGYDGDMFNCAACVPGKFKRFLGTSSCMDCPANTEALGIASKVCASLPGYNGLGYALDDVGRSCGASLTGTCTTLSNGATSTGTAADGALDSSVSTFVSVSFNPNLARSCGNTGTGSCFASHEPVFLGAASLANDGNTNTRSEADYQIGSVRPYWRVDFGQSRTVFAVKILSLAWQYLKDFKITVGDSPDAKSSANVVCADYLTGSGSNYMTYNCEDSVNGRYLYVINGPHASNYLSISEVVVEAFNYTAAPSAMLPWWAVDFEIERAVSGLVIRTQASSVVQVRVGHSTDPLQNAVCAQNRTLSTTANNTLMCSSAMLGRYLSVIGTGNTLLVLNDVRVLGFPAAQCAAGTYKPLVGNHNCTACPAFSTSVVGATSIAQCSCRAGYLDVWS